MASSENVHAGTPTQRVGFKHTYRKSDDLKNAFVRPTTRDNRSLSGGSSNGGISGLRPSPAGVAMPGSFNPDMRSIVPVRSHTPQNELSSSAPYRAGRGSLDEELSKTTEERQALVRDKIAKEMKIKIGTENMLEALMTKNPKQTRDQRLKVEQELGTSNRKLAELQLQLDEEIQRTLTPITPPNKRMSSYFRLSPMKSPPDGEQNEELAEVEAEAEAEETSPTLVFTEILQQLEEEGLQPDYYIERANRLVDLFKKNPTLKYDIAWSVFSGRVQLMLLSESTDVVAAGYRLTRHAIADRASLKTIRQLHTDELVTLSLVKKSKAILEREQAIKFVRAFFDVKDGVHEVSLAVVRSLVAIAEHQEDRLKNMCLLTLTELLAKKPELLIAANGMTTLTDALADGSFPAPEGLVASFLFLLDNPKQRKYLGTGREFEAMFAPFTDPLILGGDAEKLKTCAKGISAMMKTWPGYLTLARDGAVPLKSLIDSLVYPDVFTRDLILELLFDILRIKPPSWSSSYLAGRRLTTYGRVNQVDPSMKRSTHEVMDGRFDLTAHFTAIVLATFLKTGLVPALMNLLKFEEDSAIKRKSTLLVTEVLKLAHHSLPRSMSAGMQVLGDLLSPFDPTGMDFVASNTSMVYQIESINRTAYRTGISSSQKAGDGDELAVGSLAFEKARFTATMDIKLFAQAVLDTGVPNHTNYTKWNWNLINSLIDGPLTNTKLLDESMRTTKFLKRLVGFYRPFKWRFSLIRNTRPNQRYVRTGCALMRTLCQTQLGVQYLSESKLLRQIAECLAQLDQYSGLTSSSPLFDRHNMIDYLTSGYFAMLGALSESVEGLQIMERWHMMNMFYHILQLPKREDLLKALLGNMDYSLDSHLRVMLSQALTAVQKDIRLFATKLLRKHAVGRMRYSAGLQDEGSSQWAIKLVLTQLYDPDVEVCEVAVKILEEACDQPSHLEFVVKCRPSLDHLGEIGAPLLLRFLSISTGYRYLSGLDYIHQEMDDWFLGRNDSYVAQVEASLARAYMDPGIVRGHNYRDEDDEYHDSGLLPPHFYRELARTEEGCKLLLQSGHFYEFASTIRDFKLNDDDNESLTKVKSCMWAVGNIGSMEMGAPFLEESDIVHSIVRIAEGAEVMSVRGTACFALGLISRTTHGFAMLTECDWAITTDASGRSLGLCIPSDIRRLCLQQSKRVTTYEDRQVKTSDIEKYRAATTDSDPVFARALKLIVDMGNSVMYKKVAGDLQILRAKHPAAFTTISLFQKTLFILESHHYRLQARQFILDLFDSKVLRQIVLDEDTEESESDTG